VTQGTAKPKGETRPGESDADDERQLEVKLHVEAATFPQRLPGILGWGRLAGE
jgi:hypothetical protein